MLNKILNNQIETKSLYQSYIFEGDAKSIEKEYMLFIEKLFDTDIDVNSLFEIIQPETNNITIDQIREFNKKVFEKPTIEYKVIIIKDAGSMRSEAQNAMLKTLEELPIYVIVIMTTDNRNKLLDTIISRSQIIKIDFKDGYDIEDENTKKVIDLLYKSMEGNLYLINKEKNTIKDISIDKRETLYIMTRFFSDVIDFNMKYKKYDKKYIKYLEKFEDFTLIELEEILLKIENIKELLAVNINFSLAIEDLILYLQRKKIK